jgi:hypothetical protein
MACRGGVVNGLEPEMNMRRIARSISERRIIRNTLGCSPSMTVESALRYVNG